MNLNAQFDRLILDRFPDYNFIYCDGSKTNDRVSRAFIIIFIGY